MQEPATDVMDSTTSSDKNSSSSEIQKELEPSATKAIPASPEKGALSAEKEAEAASTAKPWGGWGGWGSLSTTLTGLAAATAKDFSDLSSNLQNVIAVDHSVEQPRSASPATPLDQEEAPHIKAPTTEPSEEPKTADAGEPQVHNTSPHRPHVRISVSSFPLPLCSWQNMQPAVLHCQLAITCGAPEHQPMLLLAIRPSCHALHDHTDSCS